MSRDVVRYSAAQPHQSLITVALLPHSLRSTSRMMCGFSDTCVPFTRLYLRDSMSETTPEELQDTYAVMNAQGLAYFSASMNGIK